MQKLTREQRGSPGKRTNKLGALYNPNYVDPRAYAQGPVEMSPKVFAGIKTDYGVHHLSYAQQKKHHAGATVHPDNFNYLLASGKGTGSLHSGIVPKINSKATHSPP